MGWDETPPPSDVVAQNKADWDSHPPDAHESSGLLDAKEHPYLHGAMNALPIAGSLAGSVVGAAAGTAVAPGPGTVAGEMAGAGAGQAAGSAAKDMINNWVFGEKKSASDIGKDAALEGGIGAAAQGVGGLVMKGAGALADTGLGQAITGAVKSGAEKLGEMAFKVPKAIIDRYAKAADIIGKMSADSDGNVAVAADSFRQATAKSIDDFRSQMNQKIGAALAESDKTVDSKPILDALETAKAKLNPRVNPEGIAHMDNLIKKVNDVTDDGSITVKNAQDLKQWMQNAATNAYVDPGMSQVKDVFANGAKAAGAVTRKLVNEAAPEMAEANNQLAALHVLQQKMTKSLITPGTPESGLIAAGKYSPGSVEGSARNFTALKRLGDLIGQDLTGGAQNLATMQIMGNASLKHAGAGAGVGAALGAGAAYEMDQSPWAGAAIGGAIGGGMTSPLVLKKAIDIGRAAGPAVNSAAGRATLGQSILHGSGAKNALMPAAQPSE